MSASAPGSDWSGEEYAAHSDHHRRFDDWFLDRLPPEPDDVVVDLGCGSGEFTARVARIVNEGRVIGVEPDPSMLEAARRHENPRLEFVQASAEDFDEVIEAASADKVLSRAMLHWLPFESHPRVFGAVFRVLRPGGWYHSESGGSGNVPRIHELLEDLAASFGLEPPSGFPDTGLVLEAVESAGFEVPVEGVRTIAQRRPFSRDQLVGMVESQPIVALTRHVDEAEAAEIVDAAVADIDRLARHDGTYDQTFVRLEILARRPD